MTNEGKLLKQYNLNCKQNEIIHTERKHQTAFRKNTYFGSYHTNNPRPSICIAKTSAFFRKVPNLDVATPRGVFTRTDGCRIGGEYLSGG